MLFAELASDFGGELVVGGGPFREPPTVMQSTVYEKAASLATIFSNDSNPWNRIESRKPKSTNNITVAFIQLYLFLIPFRCYNGSFSQVTITFYIFPLTPIALCPPRP